MSIPKPRLINQADYKITEAMMGIEFNIFEFTIFQFKAPLN